ncbi:hypothetical protein [Paenibacillus sp. PCH8]|uniref:galactose-binding domain-containing protein n=1 Tax=Paenibacillus sp. PCH8 TaxID=2066524 RepID=UPI0011B00A8B|nr:hypothetical protein [Paenibacillus sp. PCH8]
MYNVRSSIQKAWAYFLVIALLLPLLVGLWPSNVHAASNNEGNITLTADNEFTLFINGKQTGNGNDWTKAYTFPIAIQTGTNVIAVQAKDLGLYAGLLADLSYGDENLVTDFNWKVSERYIQGWEQPKFDDTSWSRASDFGRYGSDPWKKISGMPEETSARWIWAGKTNVDTPVSEAYFRISFNVSEDGLAISNPMSSSGQFEQVDYQLKPTQSMPSSIARKLPLVNAVFETVEEKGSIELNSQEAAQLGNNLAPGQIFLDQSSARAIKVASINKSSVGVRVEYTTPGVEELFDYYDIPEQEVSFEERNIVMPDPDMVLDSKEFLVQETPSLSEANIADDSEMRQFNIDNTIQNDADANPDMVADAESMDITSMDMNDVTSMDENDVKAMDMNDIIRAAGAGDFANCKKSGNEFVCDFKKVLVNQQNANGNKVYVEAGGKLTLIAPKVTGKYGFWGKYDLKFTAGEKANIYIKGDAKFKKEVKVPIMGLNLGAGNLGAVSVGVFLVIGIDGNVTFEFQVDQGYTVTVGVKGKTRVFIPVKIQPYSSVNRYLTVTHKIEGQITAWAGAKAEVGLKIAGKKILEVSVFAGIEGTGKWTSSTDVPSAMSLTIDALVKGEGAVFNKSFKLFELRWNLVRLVKNPTNPGTGQNLARNAAITVNSTYPGYSANRINDGDRNTALGENYSWANDRNSSLPQYVVIDLPTASSIKRIDLYTTQGYPLANYDLQYWNGSTWVNLVQITGNQELTRSHTFTAVSTAKVRVVASRGPAHQPTYVRINELEIY